MDKYTKGKVVEEQLDRASIPIPNLPNDFLWMQVKGGSKMQRLTDHAKSILSGGQCKSVVWTGSGNAVIRTVACAETIKQTQKCHQITKIGYRKCEEYWEPKVEGLDQLVVHREIPVIHILLSLDPLDPNEPGYQAPDNKDAFWKKDNAHNSKDAKRKNKPRISPDEIAAMGLQSHSTKSRKNHGNFGSKKKSQADKS